MILSQWKTVGYEIDEKLGPKSTAGVNSLLDYKRVIFLFVSKEELETTGCVKNGKAVIVNMSASKVTRGFIDIPIFVDTSMLSNSTMTNMNIYTFEVEFYGNIKDKHTTCLFLRNSTGSGTLHDFNDKTAYRLENPYYSYWSREYCSEYNNAQTFNSKLPDPRFYTIDHMQTVLGDVYNVFDISDTFSFTLDEMIDDKTEIHVFDSSKYLTLVPRLYNQLREVRKDQTNKNTDPTEISETMLYTKLDAMLSGYSLIYDTQMGINILPTQFSNIAMKDYRLPNNVVAQWEYMKQSIESIAHELESIHGSVRINYIPFLHADKMKINFKDYSPENQPIGYGGELSAEFNKGSSIDSGTIVKNDVDEVFESNYE